MSKARRVADIYVFFYTDDLFTRRQVKMWSRSDVIFAYDQNGDQKSDSTCDQTP